MAMEGMEIIAIAVVVGLFIVVLKQFGIWEPLSLEGKTSEASLEKVKMTNLCSTGHFILFNLLFDFVVRYSNTKVLHL